MVEFEWDIDKAKSNEEKHGVSFDEASTAFQDALSLTILDPEHSEGEYRYLLLGSASSGRLLVVSHTERNGRIRLINARLAKKKERKDYENTSVL